MLIIHYFCFGFKSQNRTYNSRDDIVVPNIYAIRTKGYKMPKQKRYKTNYPSVYYINGRGLEKGTKEKVYYILFRKNGKLIEEKAGRQFQDKMSPSRASQIRDQKLAGKLPLNRDQKKSNARHGSVDKSLQKVDETHRFELYRGRKIAPDQLNKILNAIFSVSTDGLSISDRQGNIIACNEAISNITGLNISEFVGKNAQDLVDNGILDKAVTLEVLATKRQANIMVFIKPTEKNILSTGTPVFDEDGNIDMILVNDCDMTQLNNLKAKLDETRLVTEKYKDKLAELSMANLKEQLIVAASEKMCQILTPAINSPNWVCPI